MLESVKIPNFYRVTLLYCSSCGCGDIGYSCITWVVAAAVDFVKRIRVRRIAWSPPALLATCRASAGDEKLSLVPCAPVHQMLKRRSAGQLIQCLCFSCSGNTLCTRHSKHRPYRPYRPHRARGSPAKYSTSRPTTATYRSHPTGRHRPPPARLPKTTLHSHYVTTLT